MPSSSKPKMKVSNKAYSLFRPTTKYGLQKTILA